MASQVTFTANDGTDPVRALDIFLATSKLPSREAMEYAGQRQITRIKQRTMQGIDVNGSAFAPYSPKYAKFRKKRGRSMSPVDLVFTGIMQTGLTVDVRGPDLFAIVEKNPQAEIYGRAHNEGNSRLPKRRWFDTSADELGNMTEDLLSFGGDDFVQSIG